MAHRLTRRVFIRSTVLLLGSLSLSQACAPAPWTAIAPVMAWRSASR